MTQTSVWAWAFTYSGTLRLSRIIITTFQGCWKNSAKPQMSGSRPMPHHNKGLINIHLFLFSLCKVSFSFVFLTWGKQRIKSWDFHKLVDLSLKSIWIHFIKVEEKNPKSKNRQTDTPSLHNKSLLLRAKETSVLLTSVSGRARRSWRRQKYQPLFVTGPVKSNQRR